MTITIKHQWCCTILNTPNYILFTSFLREYIVRVYRENTTQCDSMRKRDCKEGVSTTDVLYTKKIPDLRNSMKKLSISKSVF